MNGRACDLHLQLLVPEDTLVLLSLSLEEFCTRDVVPKFEAYMATDFPAGQRELWLRPLRWHALLPCVATPSTHPLAPTPGTKGTRARQDSDCER